MLLSSYQKELNQKNTTDFTALKAVFINCTLKKSPEKSNTSGLISMSAEIMKANGIKVDVIRPVDYQVAFGVSPDMKEEGWDYDDWPIIQEKVMEADILVIATPIWLGQKSSVAQQVIERLDASSGKTNEKGQSLYYGKVGGCLVTGNEDGIKHVAMGTLYSLQHFGFVIPPQADAGWIGEVGPGKSYMDEGSGGPENDFTNKNTTFMTWNLMHMAKMLNDYDGIPAHGNQPSKWSEAEHKDKPNPEYL